MLDDRGQITVEYAIVVLVIVSIIISGVSLAMVSGISVPKNIATTRDVNQAVSSLEDRISTLEDKISSLEKAVTGKAPPNLTVSSIDAPPAKTGEKTTLSVTVMNTGEKEGSKNITLIIDGEEWGTKSVTVPGGGSKTVPFVVTKEKKGDYRVKAGGQTVTWSVTGKAVEKPEEFRILWVNQESGSMAPLVKRYDDAAEEWVRLYNEEEGGVYTGSNSGEKVPVNLIALESDSSIDGLLNKYKRGIDKYDPHLLIGPYGQPWAIPLDGIVKDREIPLIQAQNSRSPRADEAKNFWSVSPIGRSTRFSLDAAEEINQKADTVALIAEDTSWPKFNMKGDLDFFEEHGTEVVYKKWVSPGKSKYSSIMVEVKSAQPDYVMMFGWLPQGMAFTKEFFRKGMDEVTNGLFLLDTGAAFTDAFGSQANGVTSEVAWAPGMEFRGTDRFLEAMNNVDMNPMKWQWVAYTIVPLQAAVDAANRAESFERRTLMESIRDTHIESLCGELEFAYGKMDSWSNIKPVAAQVVDGEFVAIGGPGEYEELLYPVPFE